MRFTGAGDVKLLMAVGAFLGFPQALLAGLIALVLGGVLGLLTAARFGRLGHVMSRSLGLARWLAHRAKGSPLARPTPSGLRVPFGVAIALATVLVVLLPGLGGSR
jgi:prepilin peptidase CpaA